MIRSNTEAQFDTDHRLASAVDRLADDLESVGVYGDPRHVSLYGQALPCYVQSGHTCIDQPIEEALRDTLNWRPDVDACGRPCFSCVQLPMYVSVQWTNPFLSIYQEDYEIELGPYRSVRCEFEGIVTAGDHFAIFRVEEST